MQTQLPTNKVAVQKLLIKSRIETDTLKERELLCPECGFRIQTLYSDTSGHLRVKCPKCKGIYVLNLAYFRRIQQREKHRVLDWYDCIMIVYQQSVRKNRKLRRNLDE